MRCATAGWRARAWVVGCALALVIGWLAGSAWQAWAVENQVIVACINRSGQVLSLHLGTPPSTRRCARLLYWSQSGPAGPRGPQGPPGEPGTQWFFQANQPAGAAEGDFWVDSDNGQLWRYSGTAWISTGFALSSGIGINASGDGGGGGGGTAESDGGGDDGGNGETGGGGGGSYTGAGGDVTTGD